MVKADPKRDYYKDLELPQSADTEEIKKQFRLLGTFQSLDCQIHADPEQPSSIIPIETEAMRSSSWTSSRPSKLPTKS